MTAVVSQREVLQGEKAELTNQLAVLTAQTRGEAELAAQVTTIACRGLSTSDCH